MKLDRDKPFGEVFGGGAKYKFTQYGKFFLMDGSECHESGKKKRPASAHAFKKKVVDPESAENEAQVVDSDA